MGQTPRCPPETIGSSCAAAECSNESDRKSPRHSDGETDRFRRRSRDSGEASDRDRCDPAPSGSADGGGGTRVNGVERPDETPRAVTSIRMIRGSGNNVANHPNEPRFGADLAAPLQGADSGRPSRSELRRDPSDDIYPTDRSSRESERHGRGARRPEVDPMLRHSAQYDPDNPSSRQVSTSQVRAVKISTSST